MNKYYHPFLIFLGLLLLSSCKKELSSEGLIPAPSVDVYVTGIEGEWVEPSTIAKYWKNSVPVSLSDGTTFISPNAIAVSGNDIYVAGTEYTDTSVTAKCWKNGTAVSLTHNTSNSKAFAIAISGNDIYIAGTQISLSGNKIPVYWKNGSLVILEGKNSTANAIAVSGSDIYLSGNSDSSDGFDHFYTSVFWKNGSIATLASGSLYATSCTSSIALFGNDVYIAGNDELGGTG